MAAAGALFVALGTVTAADAATVTFQEFTPDSGATQYDLVGNEYNSQGLELTNVFRYVDDRDTVDGVGITVGSTDEFYTQQTGTINFLSPVNNLRTQYWVNGSNGDISITAFDADDNVLSQYSNLSLDTPTLLDISGSNISRLDFAGTGGYANITTLSYTPVPEPSSILGLLGAGTLLIGLKQKYGQKKQKTKLLETKGS